MDSISLAKRIRSSILILTLAGLVIFCFPNWTFASLATALIGLALAEFFSLIERKGIFVYRTFGVIIGMLIPIIVFLERGAEGYFDLEPAFIVIACLFIFVLQFTRRDNSQALASISVTMFALLYIAWFFSFFIKIKYLAGGASLVTFLIVVTKMGDVGAYFVGNAFGRHALIPRISPKKTVEGTIGGLVFSMVSALASKAYLADVSYAHLFMLGLLLSVLGQVGDLAESVLKRDSGVKDAGDNLGGFGGVLDMIDSLLFTTPIFYFYLKAVMGR